ncbi:YraN family protein [Alloscardovia macacae]|uniref:UPF0102 protein ALMA_0671 n=1 Tax=Alloscardovia macacae TaxID=1160091 RepID=A0A1Y2T2Q3_9BIFI|nr:YraN family protein [Alloscardovia macacae]OTA27128.1 hypothetical protein B9G54_02495 [Alloscardovia macacae]OTA29680.1 hypothetical protein B9T39_02260 [Alloscardovia macacae]OZG54210.1 endonuclease [Alloscardovia macacae]
MTTTSTLLPPDSGDDSTRGRAPLRPSSTLGRFGENYACEYLTALGWSVLDRNWYCRFGEIDIVALCPETGEMKVPVLVFIEVKTRTSRAYGDPLDAITPTKCVHLRKAAVSWMAQHHAQTPRLVRFDAIGIIVTRGTVTELTHVRRIGS